MTEPTGRAPKGRPTPKRSDATRRRSVVVTPPPANRKEAAARLKEEQAALRSRVRAGTAAGDDRFLVARDRGPVRRLVRDLVDSRRSVAVILLPASLIVVVSEFARSAVFARWGFTLYFAVILTVLLDLAMTTTRVRSRLKRDFPEEKRLGGHVFYALSRSTQFRRVRRPPPRVTVGTPV